ncbi:MAG: hypothetical protein ACREB5_03570 [Sphingomonadaceae bacterium]
MIGKHEATRGHGHCAPAVGCFGQLHETESHDGTQRQHPAEDIAAWDRFAERFAMISYGDGRVAKEPPQTS